MSKGKHIDGRAGEVPVEMGHTHAESNKATTLLAIAIVGVLIIALQLFSVINSRGAQRTKQLEEIQQQIDANNRKNYEFTCKFMSTIPPDHAGFDALREALKCGTYIPPKKTGDTTSSSKAAGSSAASANQAAGSSSTRKTPNAAIKPPSAVTTRPPTAGGPTSNPTSTDLITRLGLNTCVLVVCLK